MFQYLFVKINFSVISEANWTFILAKFWSNLYLLFRPLMGSLLSKLLRLELEQPLLQRQLQALQQLQQRQLQALQQLQQRQLQALQQLLQQQRQQVSCSYSIYINSSISCPPLNHSFHLIISWYL